MIPIELDRQRYLDFTPKNLADMEYYLGYGIIVIFSDPKYSGVRTTRGLLWAGLRKEDPEITFEKVDELIEKWLASGKSFTQLEETLAKAVQERGWIPKGEIPLG